MHDWLMFLREIKVHEPGHVRPCPIDAGRVRQALDVTQAHTAFEHRWERRAHWKHVHLNVWVDRQRLQLGGAKALAVCGLPLCE